MSAYLLDKTRVRRSFAAASDTYDAVARLQRTVGLELLQNIAADHLAGTLLDLGCGTGFLTAELLKRQPHPDALIALDLAWPMLQSSRSKLEQCPAGAGRKVHYVCADAERLPFADRSLNGVFSNLALQWCSATGTVFTDVNRTLKPDGLFAFSTFGPETLCELKQAWAEADGYSHVNEFHGKDRLLFLLEQAGFRDLRTSIRLHRPRYASVRTLMQELKHIGAHNVNSGRNKGLTTRTRMQAMISAYEQHREDGLIPASFEVIQVVARA
ncbi:MAG: malonyl-ACP O-methyltransferase BioC [Gammaproteobacteria bacterium]